MGDTYKQQYFETKSDTELDVLVAESYGLTYKNLAGEGVWVDKTGAIIHLVSEFKPTSNTNFALTLLHELAIEGNVLAINTADVITKEDCISIGGFPKDGDSEFPVVIMPMENNPNFGTFRKTILRAISIFYIMHRNMSTNRAEEISGPAGAIGCVDPTGPDLSCIR